MTLPYNVTFALRAGRAFRPDVRMDEAVDAPGITAPAEEETCLSSTKCGPCHYPQCYGPGASEHCG